MKKSIFEKTEDQAHEAWSHLANIVRAEEEGQAAYGNQYEVLDFIEILNSAAEYSAEFKKLATKIIPELKARGYEYPEDIPWEVTWEDVNYLGQVYDWMIDAHEKVRH